MQIEKFPLTIHVASILTVAVLPFTPNVVLAATRGTVMLWETPYWAAVDAMTGPIAAYLGALALVVFAAAAAFSEPESKGNGLARVGFWVSLFLSAPALLTLTFTFPAGATWW